MRDFAVLLWSPTGKARGTATRPDGGDIPPSHLLLHNGAAHGQPVLSEVEGRPWRHGGVGSVV